MRTLSRGGVEGPGRSPGARGTAAAVCRTAALRYTTWLERGQSRRVDEVCRRQSVGRRHHRDFLISRLTASAVRITAQGQDAAPFWEGPEVTRLLCLGRGLIGVGMGITDHLPLEGGGRPAQAGREGVTAVPQIRHGCFGGAAATPPRTAFGSRETYFALPLQGRV